MRADKADRIRNAPPRGLLSAAEWQKVVDEMSLSPQQAQIVALILQGKRDKQIASALGLSVATVRTYLSRAFAHAGVGDRVELVLRVFESSRRSRRRGGRHPDG